MYKCKEKVFKTVENVCEMIFRNSMSVVFFSINKYLLIIKYRVQIMLCHEEELLWKVFCLTWGNGETATCNLQVGQELPLSGQIVQIPNRVSLQNVFLLLLGSCVREDSQNNYSQSQFCEVFS